MEQAWLASLVKRFAKEPGLSVPIGDDAAVLEAGPGEDREWVVTTDMLMDGVDFRLAEIDAARAGRKALAVNLSDLAAMGARPVAAFISLALPRPAARDLADRLYSGLVPLAKQFGVSIAGGDTNVWDNPLAISITAIGTVRRGKAWRRSGGKLSDWILATGAFGGSILAKHLDFTPRVREAVYLAEHYDIHAAIDVSDGLSLDIARLAEASGVGGLIFPKMIPISRFAKELALQDPSKGSALDHALGDGEDFELILCTHEEEARRIIADKNLDVPITAIGGLSETPGLWQMTDKSRKTRVIPKGYEH
jgi:thiamine-monophosphate kinase